MKLKARPATVYAYRHSINVVDLLKTVTAEGRGDYTHIDG